MTSQTSGNFDEIDRVILSTLTKNPRTPYAEIAETLAEHGHEMSGEGIRYRVNKLLDATSVFFMLNPEEHDWHILRCALTVADEPDAKREVVERLREMGLWFVGVGLGSFDIYAVATAPTTVEIDSQLTELRGVEHLADLDYFIETSRSINMNKCFPTLR